MRERLRALGTAVVLTMALTGTAWAVCGDGVLDAGEACDDGNAADGDCCSSACTPAEDADPCDDGRACTADDACLGGTCTGIPSNALCPLSLDRLVCWGARGRGFASRKGEVVPDEFRADGAGQALDVRGPSLLCGAAVPDDAGRSVEPAARIQLVAHRARATRTKPRQKPLGRGLTVQHALGAVQLTIKRPSQLLVPAGVAATPEAATVPGPTASRFACYAVKAAKRRKNAPPGTFASGATIALSDLRGGPLDYVLGAPIALCASERTGAAGPTARPGYLLCHRAKARSRVGSTSFGVASSLGAGTLKAKKAVMVCLPAVIPPPDVTAGQPAFPFLTGTGAANEAMRVIWKGGFDAPHTSAAASAHDQAMDAAKVVIAANLPAVQDELLKALQMLPTDDIGGHASLGSLLDAAGDGDALHDHFETVLMSPPHGPEQHPHQTPPDELTRLLLLEKLGAQANEGSPGAIEVLFKAAGSPDASTVQQAIRSLYRTGRSRRLLQRELRKHVAAENRYLLYLE